jgi:Flp pilus assembly protein TadB
MGSPASQSAVSQDQSCQTAATKDDKGKADQGSGHVQHIDWMVVVVVVVVVIVVVVFLVLLALLVLLVIVLVLFVVVVVVICGIILFWENNGKYT